VQHGKSFDLNIADFEGRARRVYYLVMKDLFEVWGALKFLFIGPLILALLLVINLMTSPGNWWIQWPTLGIGIAWVICLLRVLKTVVVVGGLAALISWLRNR
jgi:hypothetical protein